MDTRKENRRGFLGHLATAVLGGLAVIPILGASAQAGQSRRRGWGWGYPGRWTGRRYRWTGRRGYYGGGGFTNRGYYAPGYYAPPVYVTPPVAPLVPQYVPVQPPYYTPSYPLMQRTARPFPDPLGLLEV